MTDSDVTPKGYPAEPATQAPAAPQRVGSALAEAFAAGIVAFVVATGLESLAFRLAAGRLDAFEWISDALLATAFVGVSFLWLRLRASREALSRLERAKVALDTQLEVAAGIQSRLLPAVPPHAAGCRWAARLAPASHVGGDYFDFLELPDGSLLVLVADISGHGIPAALLLSATRTLFRSATRASSAPEVLLADLSKALHDDHGGLPYATAILIKVSADGRELQAANAGHPPGLVLGAAGLRRLDVGGPPAGLFPGTRYERQTLELSSGDVGLLVTDGVSEPAESAGGLEALLRRAAGAPPDPKRIADVLMRAATARDGSEPPDDRTLVVFVAAARP